MMILASCAAAPSWAGRALAAPSGPQAAVRRRRRCCWWQAAAAGSGLWQGDGGAGAEAERRRWKRRRRAERRATAARSGRVHYALPRDRTAAPPAAARSDCALATFSPPRCPSSSYCHRIAAGASCHSGGGGVGGGRRLRARRSLASASLLIFSRPSMKRHTRSKSAQRNHQNFHCPNALIQPLIASSSPRLALTWSLRGALLGENMAKKGTRAATRNK